MTRSAAVAGLVMERACSGFDGAPFADGDSPILLAVLATQP